MALSSLPLSGLSAPVRTDWLKLHHEDVLSPSQPIIDAHHHLWDRVGDTYLIDEYAADTASGHRIVASVYVDCRSMYRRRGPEAFRSVGEVEFANGMAAIGENGIRGDTLFCAAIVGNVDLRLGDEVRPVLAAMAAAGGGRFRGIRQVAIWDADERVCQAMPSRPARLLMDDEFRRGFGVLTELGCSFDAFVFHPQLREVADLAGTFPGASIILDHCGGPLGLSGYAQDRDAFNDWRRGMREVAAHANVSVKLSGLGMRMAGFDFHERLCPPSSDMLAEAWRPYVETCIELFGVDRCMFASNFSPDKGSCAYATLWNAFKRLTCNASGSERDRLFMRNAERIYRIALDDIGVPG